MNQLDELSTLEDAIDVENLRHWLASEQWSLSASQPGIAEVWSLVSQDSGEGVRQIYLPLALDARTFGRRWRESLEDLLSVYDLNLSELVERVAAVRSDLFFVRLQQDSVDGTIPFGQAAEAMASIQRLVRAAATTAANPRHSHQGRRPAVVGEFLDDRLRFGHTKRGSFIITVAARLPSQATAVSAPTADNSVDADSPPTDEVVPFERRVMTTLASALRDTQILAADPDAFDYTEEIAERGISVELLQSILDVTEGEGLQAVDIDFEWANNGGSKPEVSHVSIAATDRPGLTAVRDKIAKREPTDDVTIIGRVAELARENVGGGQEELSAVLEAELFGRMRKVRVPLIESDYDWAIYAHQRRVPFTVSGTPIKKGSWRLSGIVKADLEFLRQTRSKDGD